MADPGLRPRPPDPRDEIRAQLDARQQCAGTVIGIEFPGAPGRHYPIESPESRALNDAYADEVRAHVRRARVRFAGRLATYRHLDMDDCIRQALDCADELAASAAQRTR